MTDWLSLPLPKYETKTMKNFTIALVLTMGNSNPLIYQINRKDREVERVI